jgi:hypothetical protein
VSDVAMRPAERQRRRRESLITVSVVAAIIAVPAAAEVPRSAAVVMSFDQCLEAIRKTASQLGVAPINIVETDILRMVRFCTDDGSIVVTCSRADQRMVITRSPPRPGCD